jgi:hypothetical protein
MSDATPTPSEEVKQPKNNKGNRYYYRHREEILARKREQRLADPDALAKYEERQRKKAEREAIEAQRAIKREGRKTLAEKILNPTAEPSGVE